MALRERKYYFLNGNLYQVKYILPAEAKVIVKPCNSPDGEHVTMNLTGAQQLFEPAFKQGDVARLLGCHPDTIRKWERRGHIDPPKRFYIGSNYCRFYSEKEIEDLQEVARSIHHGRPRKDKLVRNNFPDLGTLKQELREKIRRMT